MESLKQAIKEKGLSYFEPKEKEAITCVLVRFRQATRMSQQAQLCTPQIITDITEISLGRVVA